MLYQAPPLWNLVHLFKMFCEFTRACKEFGRVKTWREKHSVGSHSLGRDGIVFRFTVQRALAKGSRARLKVLSLP